MGFEERRDALLRQGVHLVVQKSWDGEMLPDFEEAQVSFRLSPAGLEVTVRAPYYDDPAPVAPRGELDGLWEYEVVELFLVGAGGHYLEIEVGPHGHYLILLLSAVRQVEQRLQPRHCATRISGRRWQTTLTMAWEELPQPLSRANAFAIHGLGSRRRYLAAFPLPGQTPDFHQPRSFPALVDLAAALSSPLP